MKQLFLIISFFLLSIFTNAQEAINSLTFDGVNEHVSLGNPPSLQLTNYTIELWFYGTNNTKSILTRGKSRGSNWERTLDLCGNGTNLIFFTNSFGGGGNFHTIGTYVQNQWNHVAIVKNGTTVTSYLNGINTGTSTLTLTPSTNAFSWEIGGNGQYYHNGRIDEVKIWNSARTANQIRDDMHSLKIGNEIGLVAYYNFNDTTGSTLTDLTTPTENGATINMENTDWTTAYDPIGNNTARGQTDLRGIWEASGTINSLESDGFWMNVGTSLTETNYATYGHDAAGNAIVYTDLPAGVVERYEQIWYVDVFGTVIPSITFDLSTIHGLPITAGIVSGYRLLYRTGTAGTFTDLGSATSIANIDQVTFSGIALTDGYYTIGTLNGTASPLPIELISFNAVPINNRHVNIEWMTASEINNDYFTIERSIDGIDWEEITKVDGSGNSSTLLTYNSIDKEPYWGISDYRLKQTDFDGQFKYSQVKSVNIERLGGSQINIYPNPIIKRITIEGNKFELKEIKIYNILGQDVTLLTKVLENNETKLIIDLSYLSKGIYYVKTKTTANKVYKQ